MCSSSSLSSSYASAASSATASGQTQLGTKIGITVALTALSAMKDEGDTIAGLLQSAANVGKSIDTGKALDVSG